MHQVSDELLVLSYRLHVICVKKKESSVILSASTIPVQFKVELNAEPEENRFLPQRYFVKREMLHGFKRGRTAHSAGVFDVKSDRIVTLERVVISGALGDRFNLHLQLL